MFAIRDSGMFVIRDSAMLPLEIMKYYIRDNDILTLEIVSCLSLAIMKY